MLGEGAEIRKPAQQAPCSRPPSVASPLAPPSTGIPAECWKPGGKAARGSSVWMLYPHFLGAAPS